MDFSEQAKGNNATIVHRGFDLHAMLEGLAIMLARGQVNWSSVRSMNFNPEELQYSRIQDSRSR